MAPIKTDPETLGKSSYIWLFLKLSTTAACQPGQHDRDVFREERVLLIDARPQLLLFSLRV
jgi:hypothetical protein